LPKDSPSRAPRRLDGQLEDRRLAFRYDRLSFVVQSLLQTAGIFLVEGRVAGQF
jgi:hypothetical protein